MNFCVLYYITSLYINSMKIMKSGCLNVKETKLWCSLHLILTSDLYLDNDIQSMSLYISSILIDWTHTICNPARWSWQTYLKTWFV